MTLLWLGAAVFLIIAAAFAFLLKQLLTRPNAPEFDAGWIERFSMRKYRPMERLLNERDLQFLATVAGNRPEIGRKLRNDRHRVLRAYLRSIRRDFDRLCLAGRIVALYSSMDRPELTRDLLRLQIVFQLAMCHAWVQVGLSRFGLGRVDLTQVVRPLATLHAQLVAVPAASAA